jgi:hypothetical protein
MKTLTQLNATPIEAEFVEPRGAITSLHIEDAQAKGWFIRLSLGAGGLVARAQRPGSEPVAIPLEALLELLRAQAPEVFAPEGFKVERARTVPPSQRPKP